MRAAASACWVPAEHESTGSVFVTTGSSGIEVDFVVRGGSSRNSRGLHSIVVATYRCHTRYDEPPWRDIGSVLSSHCPAASLHLVYDELTSPQSFFELSERIHAQMATARVELHHCMDSRGPTMDFVASLRDAC